jgi:hypothetical protein
MLILYPKGVMFKGIPCSVLPLPAGGNSPARRFYSSGGFFYALDKGLDKEKIFY